MCCMCCMCRMCRMCCMCCMHCVYKDSAPRPQCGCARPDAWPQAAGASGASAILRAWSRTRSVFGPRSASSIAQATSCLSAVFLHAKHAQATLGLSVVFVQARHVQAASCLPTCSCVRRTHRLHADYQLCSCIRSVSFLQGIHRPRLACQ